MDYKKEIFFNYLVEEVKRKGAKLSSEILDQVKEFIESDAGQTAFHEFKRIDLPRYTTKLGAMGNTPKHINDVLCKFK